MPDLIETDGLLYTCIVEMSARWQTQQQATIPQDSLSEAFYADAVRRVNLLTLAFALYFPAFERLRSTRSLV